MGAVAILEGSADLKLVRQTVAKDLTPAEFDMFVHMCRHWRLDPVRRQIYANVYNKDKPDRRKVAFVTSIDGYRTIADRTGNYRPGLRSFETCEKDQTTNPQGILSATATVYKFSHGAWHEFSETVYWEEFAPLKEVWEYDKEQGKKVPSGRFELDRSGKWATMGRVMLMKCAEAQVLRRGWPDDLSSLYVEEEMDRSKIIDISPSEIVTEAEQEERVARLGGPSIVVDWLTTGPLVSVPVDRLHGQVRDFIRQNAEEPGAILAFADRNRDALRQFWGLKPDEALDLKRAFETYQAAVQAEGASA